LQLVTFPGAFMQSDKFGEVNVKLEDGLAKIVSKFDPQLCTK